jgi:hypothetical protein
MEENVIKGLESFDRVWARVSPQPEKGEEKCPTDEIKRLKEFMEDEASDAALYAALSRRTCGRASSALSAMSADERRHLRELEVEYFLLTGDSFCPSPEKPEITGVLSRLRRSYISEGEGSAAYARAANETSSQTLRKIYSAHSADEACHQQTLRNLITSAMS